MSKVTDRLSTVLKRKKTVSTRAVLWKIPHDSGIEDVHLKLGRYKLTVDLAEVLETSQPKSELTLDQEEFRSLLKFLGDNYEPFRKGVKAFIPLDRPFDAENAEQIRALFSLPDKKELVSFILTNGVIPEELEAGLRQAQRARAVKRFEEMLTQNLREPAWQKWFQSNSWVLGSQFVRILDERHIDVQRKRVAEAPCHHRRRLISGRTSSMTMLSAAALPSAALRRCRSSDTVSVSPHTKATRTVLPTAASAARRIGGISPMVS